ncbi:hypothetical protein ACLI1A_07720 [Flavobacterium sp. RHBU_3]|uniref:hypothetical protein n=1 Tax=Flavobacterium sp. RHBU_3 TaxID=3391184 RepID=UPI00398487AE
MKTIHTINSIATWATLLLYISIFFGMYAQIVLGPLQLLLAVIISVIYYKELDQHHKKLITNYWTAAAIALFIVFCAWATDFYTPAVAIISLYLIPMTVACYFLYVTNKLNKYLSHEP